MFDFDGFRLADAEIESIAVDGDNLRVTYLDWQEQRKGLLFRSVLGYQSFWPEGQALSHGTMEAADPLLDLACRISEEPSSAGYRVFSFVSSWSEEKILRIVAADVLPET